MPRISEHVGIERKPKLGGGGPGKIPHRHGFGGGDDGDQGEPDDFISPKDRLRRYRIGMAAAIVAFSTFFIGMALSYILRLGYAHWDHDLRQSVRDPHPLTLPYIRLFINSCTRRSSSSCCFVVRGRSLIEKSRLREPSFDSMISSICFFPP